MTTLKLISSDAKEVPAKRSAAEFSVTIKNMIEDIGDATDINIPNVDEATLKKVMEYCEHAVENKLTDDEKLVWEKAFMDVEQELLFNIILAANYLDIKPLLDLSCKKAADLIKGKTPEEIRQTFNIKNDFTPEEEEQIRKENEWCDEK